MKYFLIITILLFSTSLKSQDKAYKTFNQYQLIYDTETGKSFLKDTLADKKIPIPYPYTKYRRHHFRHGFVYVRTGDMKALMTLEGKKILDPCHYILFNSKDSVMTAYICNSGSWMNLNYAGDTISFGYGVRHNYARDLFIL